MTQSTTLAELRFANPSSPLFAGTRLPSRKAFAHSSLPYFRRTLQADSVIPAKRGSAAWQIKGMRAQMRQEFPADLYRRRALIASLMSSVKGTRGGYAIGTARRIISALVVGMVLTGLGCIEPWA